MRTLARSRAWLLLVSLVLLVQLGCDVPQGNTIHIRGTVYGDATRPQEAGRSSVPVPLVAATVTCGDTSGQTAATGAFDLVVPAAPDFHCTASAPLYATAIADITSPPADTDLTLNFGAGASRVCAPNGPGSDIECPALHLAIGSLDGTITYAGAHQPAAGVTVRCWNPTAPLQASTGAPSLYSARTTPSGAYTLTALPAAQYQCVAGDDQQPHAASVPQGNRATLSFAICQAQCPAVTYHGGAVMHTLAAYLIFWLPPPYTYDATGSPARYESLMQRYFADLGGTPFYGLLTQYWDYQGAIQNSVTLAATYEDTRAYPHAATPADPLTDDDIQAEVRRMIGERHWTADATHAFFVFTGYGAEVCTHSSALICSFPTPGKGAFCGYHRFMPGANALYAEITDVNYCVGSPDSQASAGPNQDRLADDALAFLSHEQFEVVSDPMNSGWFAGTPTDGEIADRCEGQFGDIQPDGSNITLHSHPYLLQQEWSDRTNSCAFH